MQRTLFFCLRWLVNRIGIFAGIENEPVLVWKSNFSPVQGRLREFLRNIDERGISTARRKQSLNTYGAWLSERQMKVRAVFLDHAPTVVAFRMITKSNKADHVIAHIDCHCFLGSFQSHRLSSPNGPSKQANDETSLLPLMGWLCSPAKDITCTENQHKANHYRHRANQCSALAGFIGHWRTHALQVWACLFKQFVLQARSHSNVVWETLKRL